VLLYHQGQRVVHEKCIGIVDVVGKLRCCVGISSAPTDCHQT
jgi:hypothetical protein